MTHRNAMELARENEQLRAAVRDLQAGRALHPAEALAMVAEALDARDKALADAARVTSALAMRCVERQALLVVAQAGMREEEVIELPGPELKGLDGCALRLEVREDGGFNVRIRPPKSEIARPV